MGVILQAFALWEWNQDHLETFYQHLAAKLSEPSLLSRDAESTEELKFLVLEYLSADVDDAEVPGDAGVTGIRCES